MQFRLTETLWKSVRLHYLQLYDHLQQCCHIRFQPHLRCLPAQQKKKNPEQNLQRFYFAPIIQTSSKHFFPHYWSNSVLSEAILSTSHCIFEYIFFKEREMLKLQGSVSKTMSFVSCCSRPSLYRVLKKCIPGLKFGTGTCFFSYSQERKMSAIPQVYYLTLWRPQVIRKNEEFVMLFHYFLSCCQILVSVLQLSVNLSKDIFTGK